jgi:galactokinase
VRQCVAHPIYENFRVEAFRTMLQGLPTDTAALLNLGELMFQSHASYRCRFACILRCTVALDMLHAY